MKSSPIIISAPKIIFPNKSPIYPHQVKQAHASILRLGQSIAATWNKLIKAYCTKDPASKIPFLVYKQMQANGIGANNHTFPPLLKALAGAVGRQEGLQIHAVVIKSGFDSNVFVIHSLVSLYSKFGIISVARQLFDGILVKNQVSWNVMISSYSQNGYFVKALELFSQMRDANYGLDKLTLVSVLPACAHLGAIGLGHWIHGYAKDKALGLCVFLGTALLDMYCKCGLIDKAHQVFDEMLERNIVTWNAMITGFAMHGCSEKAIGLFSALRRSDIKPNYVSFIGILCACTHAGLVEKGWWYFELMEREYLIKPMLQHYACMVDLLGRVGRLDDAMELIHSMPFSPDAVIWGAMLGACRMHKNIELGEKVMGYLVELEPINCGNYVVFSNMYAGAGRWDDAANVATLMNNRGIKKKPGSSWIEVDFEIHHFFVGDRSHPQIEDIYKKLEELGLQLKATGYMPSTRAILRDIEEEDKEDALKTHSEKLAIAFGLIRTKQDHVIRIVKNLRVCIDCHTVIKLVSKIVQRVIVVRDNSRFHHFREGSCSCKDYW